MLVLLCAKFNILFLYPHTRLGFTLLFYRDCSLVSRYTLINVFGEVINQSRRWLVGLCCHSLNVLWKVYSSLLLNGHLCEHVTRVLSRRFFTPVDVVFLLVVCLQV